MVTMDAAQGLQLLHLIHPDVTIPIHNDDYGRQNQSAKIMAIYLLDPNVKMFS